jgi:hypothetical protein
MDQRMDVMEYCLQIMRCNQEIIHSQWDEPLHEFPNVAVFPAIPDPYALLTPAKLATFGIGPAHAPNEDDDDEEEAANDGEEMEDDE